MEVCEDETCVRLQTSGLEASVLYVKGTWFPKRFALDITDGVRAWICNASEQNVSDRASQWDQTVSEYLKAAKHYLGHQQPGTLYSFQEAGNGNMRLSWTLEREGTKLECRWRCEKAAIDKEVTSAILDFLMEANSRLSEEVVRKTRSFERMKIEAEKCLAQSEAFKNRKVEFETDVYAKFVAVLNAKKAKIRELREKCSIAESVIKDDDETSDFSGEDTEREAEGENEESNASSTHTGSKDSENTDIRKSNAKNDVSLVGAHKLKAIEHSEKSSQKSNRVENSGSATVAAKSELVKDHAHDEEPVVSAAGLLQVPKYTSAPKKRRRA